MKNVGQHLINQVSLEIGGSVIDTLHGEFLYINEELNGVPGKRLEAAELAHIQYKELNEAGDAMVDIAGKRETRARVYVPLCFWFQGGSLSRALKTVAMQLHRIEFKVSHKKFEDLLIAPTSDSVYVMPGQEVALGGVDNRLIKKVAGTSGAVKNATTLAKDAGAAMTMDFHGVFLNSTLRSKYLGLQETSLFITTQRQDLDATDSEKQTPLDFKNAVYEIYVAVTGSGVTGDTFGFDHASEALASLSFSISSTPRTLTQLEPQFFRKITQHLGPNTTSSDNKGLYYYNLSLKNSLNGTNMVSSYINASKVDDVRIRYSTPTSDKKAIHVYARAYNLLTVKNGMAGRLFQ